MVLYMLVARNLPPYRLCSSKSCSDISERDLKTSLKLQRPDNSMRFLSNRNSRCGNSGVADMICYLLLQFHGADTLAVLTWDTVLSKYHNKSYFDLPRALCFTTVAAVQGNGNKSDKYRFRLLGLKMWSLLEVWFHSSSLISSLW